MAYNLNDRFRDLQKVKIATIVWVTFVAFAFLINTYLGLIKHPNFGTYLFCTQTMWLLSGVAYVMYLIEKLDKLGIL